MAIAFVRSTTGSAAVPPTVTTAFGAAVTTGNLIVVTVADDSVSAATVTGVTDSAGNTYTKVVGNINGVTCAIWYAANVTGGASFTVTVAWDDTHASRCTVVAQEFSGCDTSSPLDQSTSNINTSTSPSSGATGTTTQADELVVGGVAHDSTTSAFSLGAGYSNLGTVSVANAAIGMESKVVAATGAQTATFSIAASRSWACCVATFKAAGTATSSPPPVPRLRRLRHLIVR